MARIAALLCALSLPLTASLLSATQRNELAAQRKCQHARRCTVYLLPCNASVCADMSPGSSLSLLNSGGVFRSSTVRFASLPFYSATRLACSAQPYHGAVIHVLICWSLVVVSYLTVASFVFDFKTQAQTTAQPDYDPLCVCSCPVHWVYPLEQYRMSVCQLVVSTVPPTPCFNRG
jgi:hypothetical protein